jgi:glyoxylase-like metal-dependent hydrolase (beta-lactamase superfamily II)
MILEMIVVGDLQTNCYIFGSSLNREVVVIDPGGQGELILSALDRLQARVSSIINTHGHMDHIAGNRQIKDRTAAKIFIHRADAEMLGDAGKNFSSLWDVPLTSPPADVLLQGGEILPVGDLSLRVVHTPGHSPGGICLVTAGLVFTGDTLFAGSIGRCDFPGASYEQLLASVRNELLALDDDTVIYPGHGPGSTIGAEKRDNPFFGTRW